MVSLRTPRTFLFSVIGIAMAILASLGCLVVWIFVRPFTNKYVAQRAMDWVASVYWRFLVYWVEKQNGIRARFWGEQLPHRENAFVISNHQWGFDWMTIFGLAERKGRLGSCKFFAKDSVKWIPGFGWGIWVMGSVFIKRNWELDKSTIDSTFARLKGMGGFPIWLVSWVEGTRITRSKQLESVAYAKKHSLPSLTHVLLPRTKGFIATVHGLRHHLPCLYDITVAYRRTISNKDSTISYSYAPPDVTRVAFGDCSGYEIHYHCRRWLMSELPEDDESLAQWCYKRFEEKDELLEYFHVNGSFPGAELSEPYGYLTPS